MPAKRAHAIILPPPGSFLTCDFTVSDIDFGNVDVLPGLSEFTTGTITISCSLGASLGWVTVCPNLEYGTGSPLSYDPRQMDKTGDKLSYNLYHPGTSTIWGSFYWSNPPRPPIIQFQLDNQGEGTFTYTIDARLFGGQSTARPGTYVSIFQNNEARFAYRSGQFNNCARNNGEKSPTFTVIARVVQNCLVSATNLDFGISGLLNSPRDTTGTITVRCSRDMPYAISLNGGQANATNPADRRMRRGTEEVRYGIYKDAARTQGWGSAAGQTVAGVGTGLDQQYTMYGRVPPQPTPSAGTYTDVVVVTVTY